MQLLKRVNETLYVENDKHQCKREESGPTNKRSQQRAQQLPDAIAAADPAARPRGPAAGSNSTLPAKGSLTEVATGSSEQRQGAEAHKRVKFAQMPSELTHSQLQEKSSLLTSRINPAPQLPEQAEALENHALSGGRNHKPATERCEAGTSPAHKHEEDEQIATALVSVCAGDMLTAQALWAGELTTTHLDSCATHCFVNKEMSAYLTSRGYPPVQSPTKFNVMQGNPLCSTNQTHHVPLSLVREDGAICSWDDCLFLVADAGAPIILCFPLLRAGGILRYEPPVGYEQLLLHSESPKPPRSSQSNAREPNARRPRGSPWPENRWYHPPDRIIGPEKGTVLKTAASSSPSIDSIITGNSVLCPDPGPFPTHSDGRENLLGMEISVMTDSTAQGENSELPTLGEAAAMKTAATTAAPTPLVANKRKRGQTDMLSPTDPYGKNPPLPGEVMEAVKHLKMLADPKITPYTQQQLEELRSEFLQGRPKWGNCLTVQKTIEVSDKETEQFINDLMDKPRYQKSIFSDFLDGCCDLGEYEINQKPGRDTWTPPQPRKYRNPTYVKIVDDWLDSLIAYRKIRESNATHPAPITIVEKDQRDPRVCVDYRNRNSRSEVPVYPMPDVQDFLDDTSGFEHYCSFDMAKMFNQFRIKEAHKHLAAFITHRGVYEPNVVMFGLSGGPQHAVRECGGAMARDPLTNGIAFTEWAVEQNSQGVKPPYEICPSTKVVKGSRLRPFIDDVTIPSNHTEGMKKLVELFFEFCFKHNLTLSRKKAKVMKTHLRMLGFVVSKEGKHLDPHRIISLLESPQPRSRETLHALLSSFTFIRMFIPNFASIAAPLYEATKGIIWKGPQSGRSQGTRQVDPNFAWTPEMTRAYDQLRNALLEAPILVKVDDRYALFLSVDASIRGEGWVLWQLITAKNGSKVAVAILYGSRKYNSSEAAWETTRQEASAIRSALTDVYEYVFGRHFYVFSDHLNLRFMHNSINRAVLRMRDFLAQFNMTVIHCPGIWNNADSVSRLEHEALPVTLAENLNSTTEARLDGTSLRVSRGTDTADDPYTGGFTLAPKFTLQTDDDTPALVLCTNIQHEAPAFCLLCEGQDVSDTDSYTDSDTEQSGNPHPAVSVEPPFEWDDIITHWKGASTVTNDLYQEEAAKWNKTLIENPRKGLLAEPPPEDSETDLDDLEDVDWCGPIERSATVLRIAASQNFHKRERSALLPTGKGGIEVTTQMHKDKLLKAMQNGGLKQYLGCPRKFVGAEASLPNEDLSKGTQTDVPLEVQDQFTQTTPADFRIAMIRTPLTDDFIAIHNNESGHHGLEHSYRKLLKRCGSKWANERGEATRIRTLLNEFINACPICQKVRGLQEKVKAKHSFIVSRPFLEVSYDFIVFTNSDKNGNRYLLVAIDNFLKIVEIKATKSRDSETVAQFLLELGARYGPMARLRSDREGAFTSLLITKLNETRGTESTPCIPYHPQANSICERQNGIIMNHLNALILGCKLGPESKEAWSDLVPFVFSLVNNTPKNPLGISPLSMLYGVFANYDRPLLPTPQANSIGDTSNPVDYVANLRAWQNRLLEITEDIQSEHFAKMEKRFNSSKEQVRQFNEGDFVLQLKKATNISGKPATKWIGPFVVMQRTNNDPSHPVLDLMNLTDMTVKQASINDCRSFNTSWFDEENLLPELVKLAAKDENEYVVERIIRHKPTGGKALPPSKYLFEVKWQDFTETTWEPYSGLKGLEPLIQYAKNYPELHFISRT